MKNYLFAIIFLLTCTLTLHAQSQPVEPNWESIKQRGYPQWFGDAKLGIFIHWGLYSIPSWAGKEQYGEWFLRGLMTGSKSRIEFQEKVYGKDFKYEDYKNIFKAELFNPDEWAELFERSGAKYVVLVTKHHDGYCLWNSSQAPEWNSVTSGPKRDIVGELTQSVRDKNLKMGFYYSLPEWNNPIYRWDTDPHDSVTRYVDTYMIPQFKELISTYKPSLVFTDGEWWHAAKQWHAEELISWYYNLVGDDAIVNDRWGGGADYGFRTPEYSAGITQTDRPWAECRGIGRSFGLNRNEPLENYITSEELIRHFSKLVACGGGMTLNVGPGADGQIPLLQQERLVDLGNWLQINGEAIYGSKPYSKFLEMKDVEIQRIDSSINFNWVRNAPVKGISEDNFTVEWTGLIVPKYSEEYTFEAEADDGVRIWIDNKLIIDQWKKNDDGATGNVQEAKKGKTTTNKIKLQAGKKYSIKVNYYEDIHQASISLFWKSKSQEKAIISSDYLWVNENQSGGLAGTYRSQVPYVCYTTNNNALYAIALEWFDQSMELEIDRPASGTQISLVGREGSLPWKYENGKLIIDMTLIKFTEIPCKGAWVFKIG